MGNQRREELDAEPRVRVSKVAHERGAQPRSRLSGQPSVARAPSAPATSSHDTAADDTVAHRGTARDRARGALVGLACGDAVGTTLEFEAPGTFAPIDDMVGGGPFALDAGQWTDDTSLALCLAESLLDRGGHDPIDQLRRYVLWWKRGYLSSTGRCFDIGAQTHQQLDRFVATGAPHDPDPDPDRAANGSLMRLAGVPLRWWYDPAHAAERSAASSSTTHPAPRPVDACRVLGAMIAALIGGADAADVFEPSLWQHGELHPEIEAVVRGSWRTKEPPEISGSGYCVAALEAALWAVTGAPDFRAAVLRAANLGDDADTTAAIAGQLAGARFGMSGIPPAWLQRLAMRARITSLADALFDAAGSSGSIGEASSHDDPVRPWEFEDAIHAYRVAPGLLVGEYPGAPQPARAAAKIALLVDAGIRTFIDLTTSSDPLEPYAPVLDAAGEDRGLDLRRVQVPIPDVSVIDLATYVEVVHNIDAEIAAGRGVYVHCWGGVGRAGTVVGCWLRERGLTAAEALTQLVDLRAGTAKARRQSPETGEQRAIIRAYPSGSIALPARPDRARRI